MDVCPESLRDDPVVEVSLPKLEEKVLEFWNKIDAFQTSLKKSEGRPEYYFFDGPPFATGLPHYGHLLAGTIKDVVTRYWHMMGYHVERRWGWDCHGLPVEYEIDKQFNIKGPEDVEKMGIATYNAHCRSIVMKYSQQWRETVTRMGRWIDFDNDYKTLYTTYMESLWWVFKELFNRDLVYRGFSVMPFSTACTTPLSNFEASQKYMDVSDPAVMISMPMVSDSCVSFVAWTTTPWTLPSNLAICVNPNFVYVKVKDLEKDKLFIVAECRLGQLYPEKKKKKGKKEPKKEYEVVSTHKGSELVGIEYVPLFDFPFTKEYQKSGAFRVIADDYVTDDSGTGVVHCAPGFGADDYRVCLAHKVIDETNVLCPVDTMGCFTAEIPTYAGRYVKDCDDDIMKELKEMGRLIHKSSIVHSYPFCWRSDTPLIYRAIPSWFIRVTDIKDKLKVNNKKSEWVPAGVQNNRFGRWLEDARDWVVSRNRYWGTPLPLWVSDDFEEIVCVGSVKELEELTGVTGITDLHREHVDKLEIPSKKGKGMLHRVPEVLDCWFESGSMPYASFHYPFENRDHFEKIFPADFIAEGLDQTRGWFYTLLVLSTALFDDTPFKHLIVNGLVLDEQGKKMSKSKRNFEPPDAMVEKQGADALRMYLINSPAVRAEPLKFVEKGVVDVRRELVLPLFHAFRFFMLSVGRLNEPFVPSKACYDSDNVTDVWILMELESLVQFVHTEMEAYRLYTVVPRIVEFNRLLTNWYVRFNRSRLKGSAGDETRMMALRTLFEVLKKFITLLAPYTPFIVEYIYQNLRPFMKDSEESIHYTLIPQPSSRSVDAKVIDAMRHMRGIIAAGRAVRDRVGIAMKQPISAVKVIHRDQSVLDILQNEIQKYISEELNCKSISFDTDEDSYVQFSLEADWKRLGARLRKRFDDFRKKFAQLSVEQIRSFVVTKELVLDGETFTEEDIIVVRTLRKEVASTFSIERCAHDDGMIVLMNTELNDELLSEGTLRELKTRVQKLRKRLGLQLSDKANATFVCEDESVRALICGAETKKSLEKMLRMPVFCDVVPGEKLGDPDTTPFRGKSMSVVLSK